MARTLVLVGGSIVALTALASMAPRPYYGWSLLGILLWAGQTIGSAVLLAGEIMVWLGLRTYAKRSPAAGTATACAVVLPVISANWLYWAAWTMLLSVVVQRGSYVPWFRFASLGGLLLSFVANTYALVVLLLLLGVFRRAIMQARGL